jgi:hypothetical protein
MCLLVDLGAEAFSHDVDLTIKVRAASQRPSIRANCLHAFSHVGLGRKARLRAIRASR